MNLAAYNRLNTPCPSVKTLLATFPRLGTEAQGEVNYPANRIRYAMKHETPERAMETIDGLLQTHGVEYIPQGRNQRSPAIEYCNAGDPYATTILYVNGSASTTAPTEKGNSNDTAYPRNPTARALR